MSVFRFLSARPRLPSAAPLRNWYRTRLGGEVARQETECVQRLLKTVFGYYLVQLGADAHYDRALAASRIHRHFRLVPATDAADNNAQVLGLAEQLPFAGDSVDAVLAAHTLDFSAEPQAVLAEIERILVPDGRVIILGFNPMSPWGLRCLLAPAWAHGPWCRRFQTSAKVADWLTALGCEVEHCEHLMLPGPLHALFARSGGACGGPRRRSWTRFLSLSHCFRPLFGGVYVIRAVKRNIAMTPLRPARARMPGILAGGAMRPTSRTLSEDAPVRWTPVRPEIKPL